MKGLGRIFHQQYWDRRGKTRLTKTWYIGYRPGVEFQNESKRWVQTVALMLWPCSSAGLAGNLRPRRL